MIEKISSIIPRCNSGLQRQTVKKKHVLSNINQIAKFTRIPYAIYQNSFLRRNCNQLSFERRYIEYGSSLYIGPQTININRYKAKAKLVQLEDADLRNYNFEKADFYRACLQGANLENANFRNATLYDANMRNVKTGDTCFVHANLNFADFTGAEFGKRTDMSGANLIGAKYNESTVFNEGFNPKAHGMIYVSDM